jgi:hypothetical protein
LPALAAMLRRLGPVNNARTPKGDPHRMAVCAKALDVLKATVAELSKS